MSYILDALRRAERDRGAQTPALQIVTHGGGAQIVAPGRARGPWLVGAGAVLLVVLGVAAVLLARREPAPGEAATPQSVVAQVEPVPAPAEPSPALIPAEEVLGADESLPALDDSVALDSLDQLAAEGPAAAAAAAAVTARPLRPYDAGTAAKTPPPADDEFAAEPATEVGAGGEMDVEAFADSIGETQATDADAAATDPSASGPDAAAQPADTPPAAAPRAATPGATARPSAPPPAPVTEVETVRLDPPPVAGPRPLKDMPPAYRADFPRFAIDVHVYDNAPAKRWFMIGTRRYREGEMLAEGPRVVQIVRDGVVLEYRGERVIHPLGR